MNRVDVINNLISQNKYKFYLEIGCDDNWCFDRIVVDHKVGVDPEKGGTLRMTSDDFFSQNTEMFDIIFVDGLHHADQVYKDIENSVKILNPGGVILVHDVNPLDEGMQIVPRIQIAWTGDVWKAWVKLRQTRSDLNMYVVIPDQELVGLGVIRPGYQEILKVTEELTYENFTKNRTKWLNIKT